MKYLFAASLTILGTIAGCSSPARIAEAHRTEWRAAAPRSYSFEYQRQCFCLANMVWWRITVADGRVVSATLVNPADTLLTAASMPVAEHPTIDGIFVELRRALAIRGSSVRLQFDRTYHFPTELVVDESAKIADDEWQLHVRAFAPTS